MDNLEVQYLCGMWCVVDTKDNYVLSEHRDQYEAAQEALLISKRRLLS